MKAMILAAGRGKRMRPLTDHIPKPLLEAGGQALIVHHIRRLRAAGYRELVVNTHHLGEQIQSALGDGHQWQVDIRYSPEAPVALETAGGIVQALPWLGEAPFLVINGDVWCEHSLKPPVLAPETLAHLVLVPNPEHNPQGDFGLRFGRVSNERNENSLTFSGIAWYSPQLFSLMKQGPAPLAPLLRQAAEQGKVSGEAYEGCWMDIGTPRRLEDLRQYLKD